MATNCSDSPRGNEDWFGATEILTNAGGPTVTVVLAVIP